MNLRTTDEINKIVKSFENIFKTHDLEKLTQAGYNFIYLACGFIAHYNRYGFIGYYQERGGTYQLAEEICRNRGMNQWDNFRPGERDYEYNMQKKMIYNKIADLAEKYL